MLKTASIVGAVVVTVSLLAVANGNGSEENVVSDETTVISVDGVDVEIPTLPDRLSVSEMNEIESSGSFEIALTPEELNEILPDSGVSLNIADEVDTKLSEEGADITGSGIGGGIGPSIRSAALVINPSVMTARAGDKCNLDPGRMWSRSSGYGYRYGTIGSKPKLHSCTAGVRETGLSSDVYRWNGWWWDKVAGTFNSYGSGNMQQKTVAYVCANRSSQLYKVITTGWGANSRGVVGVGRDATEETRFSCG